jgi:hypothetical protein
MANLSFSERKPYRKFSENIEVVKGKWTGSEKKKKRDVAQEAFQKKLKDIESWVSQKRTDKFNIRES